MKAKMILCGAIVALAFTARAFILPYCPLGKSCSMTWHGAQTLDLATALIDAGTDLQPRGTPASGNFICCNVVNPGVATFQASLELVGTNDGITGAVFNSPIVLSSDAGVSSGCWETPSMHSTFSQIDLIANASDGGPLYCSYSN